MLLRPEAEMTEHHTMYIYNTRTYCKSDIFPREKGYYSETN